MLEAYKTLRSGIEFSAEVQDRRSRFIAQLTHITSEQEADAFVAKVRSRHHDARHNVPAWILSDGRERCSDDGEPQRTAGMPILEVLRGSQLADVCCVVTRYFGGTLLGPGGLVRAYTAATQEAVAEAQRSAGIVEMTLVTRVTCTISYAAYGKVEHLVSGYSGKIVDTAFSDCVQLTCVFRSGDEEGFVHTLTELASGENPCEVDKPIFAEF